MVRGKLDRPEQKQEQKHQAKLQNQSPPPEGALGSQRPQSSNREEPETQKSQEREQDLFDWEKVSTQKNSEEVPEGWTDQRLCTTAALSDHYRWPTHFRPFRGLAEYHLVKHTHLQLHHSGFYWGPVTMEKAHHILAQTPQGTFLIRDSGQTDVFFTLSYQSDDGPTSVRILLTNELFCLNGSRKTFASLFALLSFYTGSSCKLTLPYRRKRPELLIQMCRRAVIRIYGADRICTLPILSTPAKDYLHAYPYFI
ncbi:suppressor of cytokine signaling 1-like [Lampris incognitus]|uniref:suppressor of cytokine signaling 1-like n=1 Tax=Lampris incognitus TaxID=2546036 RepID=UPI0024B48297|nr:suppressor of cytokine signaling 1-like [Lampris incognitus]